MWIKPHKCIEFICSRYCRNLMWISPKIFSAHSKFCNNSFWKKCVIAGRTLVKFLTVCSLMENSFMVIKPISIPQNIAFAWTISFTVHCGRWQEWSLTVLLLLTSWWQRYQSLLVSIWCKDFISHHPGNYFCCKQEQLLMKASATCIVCFRSPISGATFLQLC